MKIWPDDVLGAVIFIGVTLLFIVLASLSIQLTVDYSRSKCFEQTQDKSCWGLNE